MEEWGPTDEELDEWMAEWDAVDQAAAEYLAERIPEVREPLGDEDARWVAALVETFSPSVELELDIDEDEIASLSTVAALQHADWLGLALGVVRRGPGSALDGELVRADVERLEDIEGEIEDPEGYLQVLDMAILLLTPAWEELGVLDARGRVTPRGVWGLPRAVYRMWSEEA